MICIYIQEERRRRGGGEEEEEEEEEEEKRRRRRREGEEEERRGKEEKRRKKYQRNVGESVSGGISVACAQVRALIHFQHVVCDVWANWVNMASRAGRPCGTSLRVERSHKAQHQLRAVHQPDRAQGD
ncbi:DEAD-box ATP-dependent RNA helicase 42-like isoform X2 [Silurus meridionalis]|uniref:DEAD-box ATP-dependent RNA helicase 42-like isoform X2 n=1 Tax=Silurus meridionalis TaxID=175797 RepID=UPI001EEA5D02|nr:DEAD-box ATP-dependent RNA helicase 42-like isoform X2 [Silurus meridionalis]